MTEFAVDGPTSDGSADLKSTRGVLMECAGDLRNTTVEWEVSDTAMANNVVGNPDSDTISVKPTRGNITAPHVAQNGVSSQNFSAQTATQAFCRIANLDSNNTFQANLPERNCKQSPRFEIWLFSRSMTYPYPKK